MTARHHGRRHHRRRHHGLARWRCAWRSAGSASPSSSAASPAPRRRAPRPASWARRWRRRGRGRCSTSGCAAGRCTRRWRPSCATRPASTSATTARACSRWRSTTRARRELAARRAWQQRARPARRAAVGRGAAREREPALGPDVRAALRFPDDAQVNARELARAFSQAAAAAGARFLTGRYVRRVLVDGGAATGVELDGEVLPAGAVVVAAGSWSGLVEGGGVPRPSCARRAASWCRSRRGRRCSATSSPCTGAATWFRAATAPCWPAAPWRWPASARRSPSAAWPRS